MSEPRAEGVAIDQRGSDSRQQARAASVSSEPARSSSADLQPPPSSEPSSSSFLPPPPAQLVAALAEFETSGPGPESFRRSVPEFTSADAPIGLTDSKPPNVSPPKDDAPKAVPALAAAPASKVKFAGVVAGVAMIVIALWALFLR